MRLSRMVAAALCLGVATGSTICPTTAAAVTITWLEMAPTPFTGTVPNGSVFTVAGVGTVTLTYSIPGNWNANDRTQNPAFTTGSVSAGTYAWTNYESFATIFNGAVPLGPEVATITYTFSRTLPANSVYVGTIGLGATTSDGGGTSTTTVAKNGTYLGDYVGDVTAGASQFIDGAGTFTVQNSVTGAAGVNPHWNTNLGVIRIDDPVSSLTVTQSQLRGDGVGVNIGFDIASVPPACEFNNCKAPEYDAYMVRAFTPCNEPGGNIANSFLDGVLPSCAPPVPLSAYNYAPACKGQCTVELKTKQQLCGSPPEPCCCIKSSTRCSGLLAPDTSPASGTFSLDMVLRITGNDAVNGDMTTINTPFSTPLQAVSGKIKYKSDCLTIPADTVIPKCSSVEIVDLAIKDPVGDRFAVPGLSCCSKK